MFLFKEKHNQMIFDLLVKDVLLLVVNQLDLCSLGRMAQVNRVARRLVNETRRYQAIGEINQRWIPGGTFTQSSWLIIQACKTDNLELVKYIFQRDDSAVDSIYLFLDTSSKAEAKLVTQWLLQKAPSSSFSLVTLIAIHCVLGNLNFAQWLSRLDPTVMTPHIIHDYLDSTTHLPVIAWLRSLLSD